MPGDDFHDSHLRTYRLLYHGLYTALNSCFGLIRLTYCADDYAIEQNRLIIHAREAEKHRMVSLLITAQNTRKILRQPASCFNALGNTVVSLFSDDRHANCHYWELCHATSKIAALLCRYSSSS